MSAESVEMHVNFDRQFVTRLFYFYSAGVFCIHVSIMMFQNDWTCWDP